jgi:phosphatidylserine/phosphatidylglycerophosphate/cardiolipin synthase-like enzyme
VSPAHDVSIKLRGGSVQDVEEFFIEMWNYISKEEYEGQGKLNPSQYKLNKSQEKIPVQIVRSVTRGTLSKNGESGIFEGYRKAIANAKDFIYLENQYFTNKSIVKALNNAMNANPELQVILVLNENPDLPKYKKWQNEAIKNFGINSVHDNIDHPQIGFFTLWSTELWGKKIEIQPIYVHSKVAIIDDLWATIGTANLDGSSLTQIHELEGLKLNRNMEINVLIPELNRSSTDVVKRFRNSLWAEHLGKSGIYQNKQSEEGWLVKWQKIAYENMNLLKDHFPLKSRILPYSTADSIEDQLIDLDISPEDMSFK